LREQAIRKAWPELALSFALTSDLERSSVNLLHFLVKLVLSSAHIVRHSLLRSPRFYYPRLRSRQASATQSRVGAMPRLTKDSQPPAKQRLTLAQLAAYDDILTDALVDHVRGLSAQANGHNLISVGILLDVDTQKSFDVPCLSRHPRRRHCKDYSGAGGYQ
jgi:hypothetical protein